MKDEFKAGLVAAALIMVITVLFSSVLHKSMNVVPLLLVPALLFAGYASAQGGFRTWLILTLAISISMAVLYALP